VKFSGFRSWLQNERFLRYLNRLSFLLSLATVLVAIYDLGYRHAEHEEEQLSHFYFAALVIGVLAILLRYFIFKVHFRLKVRIFDSVLGALFVLLIFIKIEGVLENLPFMEFMNKMIYIYIAAVLYFVREFSTVEFSFNSQYLNPAQLFISSFLLIILAGTALLMLPRATYEGISLLDALFTSTSAVCVTGLIVVDTGSYFTLFGQTIILILMQIGGLGIMTFASYFSYFFRGQTSYQSQLMLKDATNSDKIGEVFSVLKKILSITFIVELLGTVFIYFSLNNSEITHIGHRLFFFNFSCSKRLL